MSDVRRINKEKGMHFFDRDTMRFFSSRIETKNFLIDGKYFITSEQRDMTQRRRYTVRKFNPETGSITTVGDFQQFGSAAEARKGAYKFAETDGT